MKRMVLLYMIVEVIANVHGESDSTSNDHSIVRGIGFPPTVLKVFIKGDIQPEEIEKLLSLYTRDDKVPSDSDLTRNRRNSITDYIGKLYSYNNLFRPYRSIFRGFKQSLTTRTPWLKKFLGGAQAETQTESFWGMALGAHTFSPFARPLAQTRMPYHRIRNQQRIDKLLGITRNYENVLATRRKNWKKKKPKFGRRLQEEQEIPHTLSFGQDCPSETDWFRRKFCSAGVDGTKPYHWIKNQEKFDKILGQAKGEETTTALGDQNQNATTRKAFHKVPLDVAGLKNITLIPHLHAITTPRRLKFCEKQCADEPEEARTKRPGGTGKTRPSSSGGQKTTSAEQEGSADECATTEKCTCTINECGEDYLCDGPEVERDCEGRGAKSDVSDSAITKNVARTKLTTLKLTTSKYTKSKEPRPTGPVWTLPPNTVLDHEKTTEGQRRALPAPNGTPEDTTAALPPHQRYSSSGTTSSQERIDAVSEEPGQSRSTCEHGNPTKQMLCIPMPIPTRIRIPYCPNTRKSTKRCTRKTTTAEDSCTSAPDFCDCQSKKSPSAEIPISVGDLQEGNRKQSESNKGKPQKIIVRISSALGEVPVVIMRDNGVSGVSLSLVNDYLLDGNNRLIKCLGQKPLSGRMDLNTQNISAKPLPHSNGHKTRHFLPHLIRHQLHGLQPKRYSFSIKYKPPHRPVLGPRAFPRNGNPIGIPNPAMNQGEYSGSRISNQLPSYTLNSPEYLMNGLGSFGLQYPAIPHPRRYQSFQMDPAGARLDSVGQPIPQMNFDGFQGNDINPTEYPRFNIHPGIAPGRRNLPRFEPPGLSLQQAFPQQVPDPSQLLCYRPPFLPIFYPNNNDVMSNHRNT